jgi:hypothetical protein
VKICQVMRRLLLPISDAGYEEGWTYRKTATARIAPLSDEEAYPRPPKTAMAMILPTTPPRYNGRLPTLSPKYHVNGMIRRATQKPPMLISNAWITGSPPKVRKYIFWDSRALPIRLSPSWRKQTVNGSFPITAFEAV